MKAFGSHSARWIGLVLSLAAILVVLAVMQYRLITQVSEADRERTQIGLETAVGQFVQDFDTELLNVCSEFRPEPGIAAARDWKRIAARYEDWIRTARHPQLVADVYVWEAGNGGSPRLLRLNQKEFQFVPAVWPSGMQALEARFLAGAKAERLPNSRLFAWTIDEGAPALLHQLVAFSPPPKGQEAPAVRVAGYLAIRLSMDHLRNRLLPELVQRHFGEAYRVEVLDTERLIFRSDPSFPVLRSSDSDFSIKLVGVHTSAARGASVIVPEYGEGRWQLLVKYRAGSLAAAIAPLRRRNLALSFGVLLLLAISMTLILVFTQRVERLAKMRMDFVAGVSHELRTPLAVICSAAENLADGVVESAQPVKEYGELIRGEGRRLGAMVEQILRFSADKPGRQFELRPIEISGAVATALVDSAPLIEKAGTSVEMSIEPGLPHALADQQGLQQCLLNLIGNAVKYGGQERWLAIRARRGGRDGVPEVQITVEDRGLGIEPDETRQIFQPFYRGAAARAVGTHGTGLGLSLTSSVAEAMGGKITLESSPGRGSAFTLHLPVAEA